MRILLLLSCCLFLAPLASAQTVRSPEVEVREVIDRMFDGMRSGDSTKVRSVFHPEARLMTTFSRQGKPALQTVDIDGFVEAVGEPHDQIWDERISGVEIRVDDNLATAWMNYSFYLGETFSHCGVNAFQLARTEEGWKVVQVADTRRKECEW